MNHFYHRCLKNRKHILQFPILCGLWLLTFAAPYAAAQPDRPTVKVVDHIWGFDGRVQPGQFNPLSILLDNQTDEAVEATVSLQRVQNMLNRTGGEYVQEVYIGAAARRWIQVYPYISNTYQTEWRLTLHDGDKFRNRKIGEFTQPRPAYKLDSDTGPQSPQVIILDKPESVTRRPTTVKHLPENIFPPYATVLFGLHTVFLDHVPDWELPRQQAFHSWLKQGGRLHLLKDSRNEFPRFAGELADLNQPLNRFTIGSGVVVRHALQREEVRAELVRKSVVVDVLKGELDEIEQNLQAQKQGYLTETEPSTIDDGMFRRMRELTFPDHNWWLIFLLAVCYIGLIFPGCFLLSKKKQIHFLATYGAIVGLSLLFSVVFLVIGRRGYGESTNLQTLAIARAEDATHWSVFEWNALFVTSGDNYSAGTAEQQSVFSTASTMDKEDVKIAAGNTGQITMRIPPFSSQTFVSRRRLNSPDWKLQLLNHEAQGSGLVKLSIQTGAEFPASTKNKYMVLAGRRIYEMKFEQESKRLVLFGSKRFLAEYCQPKYDYDYMNPWQTTASAEDGVSESDAFFDGSLPTLVQRSLLDDLVVKPAEFELPADRVRLFVYTDMPADYFMTVSAAAKTTGRILFTTDLFLGDQLTAAE